MKSSKTANGATHNYVLDGTKILRETWNGNVLTPLYDNEDSVLGILYNNTPYYFQKNLQGDVIAILNQNAQVVVRYSYDAWGKPSVRQDDSGIFLALANPYLYRSYYYDWEIGKYYLQSRYYDPVVGRFINADDVMFLGISGSAMSYNLWTYCYNSSVNFSDLTGTSPIQVFLAALFGVFGFAIADSIARGLGLFPSGKGLRNAAMYWALTGAIAVGGAAIGWFAGAKITELVATYISEKLLTNPPFIIELARKLGGSLFTIIMWFLGIDPFNYVANPSQLTALARALNSSIFVLPKAWAQTFCNLADKWGRKLFFDLPHGNYGYHIHLGGQNGQRLGELHFQVVKSVWNFLKKMFER